MTKNKSKNLKNETKEQPAKAYTIGDLISRITKITESEKAEKQKTNARYEADDIMLKKYITNDDTPDNKFKNKEYMYHICTILNSCCSTRMGAHRVYATALAFAKRGTFIEKVLKKKIPMNNTELQTIRDTLCKKISLEDTNSKEFRSYSFATKFLAFHSRYKYNSENRCSLFPIYDSQVSTVIKKYGLNKISTLKEFVGDNNDLITEIEALHDDYKLNNTIHLEDYPQFYRLMCILSIATELNLTDIDHVFWTLGDEIQKKEEKMSESK